MRQWLRDLYFDSKWFLRDLYYFLRTGDSWHEASYHAWKIWHTLGRPHRAVYYVFWRMWKYRSILWNDFDWDHGFVLELLELKFMNMAKYHRDHGITMSHGDIAMELFECAELCRRINDDRYAETEHAAHEAKWGKLETEFVPATEYGTDKLGNPKMFEWHAERAAAPTADLKEQESTEFRAIMTLEEERKAADLKRLGELISTKMLGWWD